MTVGHRHSYCCFPRVVGQAGASTVKDAIRLGRFIALRHCAFARANYMMRSLAVQDRFAIHTMFAS